MTDKPINVRIPPDLRDRIDQLRGDVPRETWIRRRLEYDTTRLEHKDNPLIAVETDGQQAARSLHEIRTGSPTSTRPVYPKDQLEC
jgi:hypothetical protein